MFRFVYEGDGYSNHLSFGEDETLTHREVSEWFNQFLRGCGYSFEGNYGLVSPEEERWLSLHQREKQRTAFIQSTFGDDDDSTIGEFPVI
jgi:hypothetical protein